MDWVALVENKTELVTVIRDHYKNIKEDVLPLVCSDQIDLKMMKKTYKLTFQYGSVPACRKSGSTVTITVAESDKGIDWCCLLVDEAHSRCIARDVDWS